MKKKKLITIISFSLITVILFAVLCVPSFASSSITEGESGVTSSGEVTNVVSDAFFNFDVIARMYAPESNNTTYPDTLIATMPSVGTLLCSGHSTNPFKIGKSVISLSGGNYSASSVNSRVIGSSRGSVLFDPYFSNYMVNSTGVIGRGNFYDFVFSTPRDLTRICAVYDWPSLNLSCSGAFLEFYYLVPRSVDTSNFLSYFTINSSYIIELLNWRESSSDYYAYMTRECLTGSFNDYEIEVLSLADFVLDYYDLSSVSGLYDDLYNVAVIRHEFGFELLDLFSHGYTSYSGEYTGLGFSYTEGESGIDYISGYAFDNFEYSFNVTANGSFVYSDFNADSPTISSVASSDYNSYVEGTDGRIMCAGYYAELYPVPMYDSYVERTTSDGLKNVLLSDTPSWNDYVSSFYTFGQRYTDNLIDNGIVNAPPSGGSSGDLNLAGLTSWIGETISGIFDTDLFGTVSMSDILGIVLGIGLFIAFLKVYAGG